MNLTSIKSLYQVVLVYVISCFFLACSDQFSYSPYLTNPDRHNINEKNIQALIAESNEEFFSFSFAVIADSHTSYDELDIFRKRIAKDSVSFVISAGDITETGLLSDMTP